MDTKAAFDREAFEDAFRKWHPDKTGPYMKHIAEYFWKASRAAIEIELPDKLIEEDYYDGGYNCAIKYCSQAITSHGIRIKGKTE